MEAVNWERLENIFHAALEIPFGERKKYLVQECAGNNGLAAEVEALIDSFEKESYFFEESVLEFGFSALHETGKDKLKNKKIGSYQIEEKIGEGGMGDVYRAVDTRLNRRVALKFLSEPLENDKTARRQLRQEAQAAAALDHPNICAVHGFEEIDGYNFIVMQFIEGKTLDQVLKDKELSDAEFKSIAGQIVSAVAFAHSHNIIHRDLKPGNIMLTSNGQIKILDFGLAKILEKKSGLTLDGDGNSHFSQNGLVIGTVAYMSPEQLRGERIDYRSDIFSLGIIFYELLTKENPYKRKSQAETIAAILSSDASQISNLTKHSAVINANATTLIEKCLEREQKSRYQSTAEILLELKKNKLPYFKSLKKIPRFLVNFIIVGLIVLAMINVFVIFSSEKSDRTIAVLPVSVIDIPPEKQYLATGLTLSIVDELSKLKELKVKFDISERLKSIDPALAGKELKVDAILSGALVNRATGTYLITKLTRISDRVVLSEQEIKINENRLTETTEIVTKDIISKIKFNLSDEEKNKLAKKDTEVDEAGRLYFEGRFLLNRKANNDVEIAIKKFQKAIELDPSFAKAWAGLADAYLSTSVAGMGNALSPQEAVRKAKEAAEKAIKLDNTLSVSYNSMGLISAKYDWNWAAAETFFRMAIERDPNFITPRIALIEVLNNQEKFDEALQEAWKAKEIDNTSIILNLKIAEIYYRKRDYRSMENVVDVLTENSADKNQFDYFKSYLFLKTVRYNEAIAILENMYASEKTNLKVKASAPLGFAYAKTGRREDALKIINNLDFYTTKYYVPSQEKAIIYAGLGDFEKAFKNLKKSCQEKYPNLPPLISDPIIDEITNEKQFTEIRTCVNL